MGTTVAFPLHNVGVLLLLLSVSAAVDAAEAAFSLSVISRSVGRSGSRPAVVVVDTGHTPAPFLLVRSAAPSWNRRGGRNAGGRARMRTSLLAATRTAGRRRSSTTDENRTWLEISAPDGEGEGAGEDVSVDPNGIAQYDLGISGDDLGVGPLSQRIWDTVSSRSEAITGGAMMLQDTSAELERELRAYTMATAAEEAIKAVLKQNGLELVPNDDDERNGKQEGVNDGGWGLVGSIRLVDVETGAPDGPAYDNWERAAVKWTPGRSFNFVVEGVPARPRELSLTDLLHALDPTGRYRAEAKQAGIELRDEVGISGDVQLASLRDVGLDNEHRCGMAPQGEVPSEGGEAFGGNSGRGYRAIAAQDLSEASRNPDGTEQRGTLMHVMDALVSHGCLVVDVSNGGTKVDNVRALADMWQTVEGLFEQIDRYPASVSAERNLGPAAEFGCVTYDACDARVLKARWTRGGDLLPRGLLECLGNPLAAARSLRRALALVAAIGRDATRIAVAAGSIEAGALEPAEASTRARLLADELVDEGAEPTSGCVGASSNFDGRDVPEERPSATHQRLCCLYSTSGSSSFDDNRMKSSTARDGEDVREIFGAHTDSTFFTVVPVAAVPGLEVLDEAADCWYSPEMAARRHYDELQRRDFIPDVPEEEEEDDDNDEGLSPSPMPWYARYLVLVPGELLQLATRDEVPAAVHRFGAKTSTSSRRGCGGDAPPTHRSTVAPFLLSGRPGNRWDVAHYLGFIPGGEPLLAECRDRTTEEICRAMRRPPPNPPQQ